jgi:predicted phage terminase large subunit-like protein
MPETNKPLPITVGQVHAERCRRSLKWFVRTFWKVLEPTNKFQDGFHIDAICDHLQHIFEIKRLLINVPPRHTKSLICSVFFPAWLWLQDPSLKFLCASYSLDLSEDLSLKCRRVVESPLYRAYFGDAVQLESDKNTQLKYATTATGFRHAVSVNSSVTGHGADLIIVDDPNDVNKAHSKADRDKVINFWRQVLLTRSNYQEGKTARVIIQQRCHAEDLSGYILENDLEDDWCKLILPFEYDPSRTIKTSLGWSDPRKRPGQALSRRIPEDEIDLFKREKGRAAWQAQYNQNPRPDEGTYFKRENFRYFTEDADTYYLDGRTVKKRDCWRYVATDLAISLKSSADFSVFVVIDVTPEGELIVPLMKRDRLDATRLVQTFKALNESLKPAYFLVERNAFQEFAAQTLRQEGLPIRGVVANTDKVTRSIPLQIKCEAGQLWFPRDASWLGVLEDELLTFPAGKWDDQVDALSWSAQEASKRFRKAKEDEATPTAEQTEAEAQRAYNAAILEGVV